VKPTLSTSSSTRGRSHHDPASASASMLLTSPLETPGRVLKWYNCLSTVIKHSGSARPYDWGNNALVSAFAEFLRLISWGICLVISAYHSLGCFSSSSGYATYGLMTASPIYQLLRTRSSLLSDIISNTLSQRHGTRRCFGMPSRIYGSRLKRHFW